MAGRLTRSLCITDEMRCRDHSCSTVVGTHVAQVMPDAGVLWKSRECGMCGDSQHAARSAHLGKVVETGDDEAEGLAGAAEAAEDEDLFAHEAGVAADAQRAVLVELLAALQERQQLLLRELRVQLYLHPPATARHVRAGPANLLWQNNSGADVCGDACWECRTQVGYILGVLCMLSMRCVPFLWYYLPLRLCPCRLSWAATRRKPVAAALDSVHRAVHAGPQCAQRPHRPKAPIQRTAAPRIACERRPQAAACRGAG